jgi:hypothetical protein
MRGDAGVLFHDLVNPCPTTSLTLEPSGGARPPEGQWPWDFFTVSVANDPVACEICGQRAKSLSQERFVFANNGLGWPTQSATSSIAWP